MITGLPDTAPRRGWRSWLAPALALLLASAAAVAGSGLGAGQLAVVVNDDDPDSVEIAAYYQQRRHIPEENVIHVRLPRGERRLTPAAFETLRRDIEAALPADIQALVFVWTTPYAVDCNALTAALTLGFDAAQCQATCAPGRASAYFDSPSHQPHTDLGLRIAMLLPATPVDRARALIDRGVLSGFHTPAAGAYFLVTSDRARSSRAPLFPPSGNIPARRLRISTLHQDRLTGVKDIMFYQTGLVSVPDLDTLGFLPGALADHLTSSGGDLLGTAQMSSLRWLDAGATASYGTVSEPCNHWQKFPHPQVLLRRYLSGDTAIEAYWKSVAWPAQGLIIGEPLAAPYASRGFGSR
jgi:uncharacterized protein (TIGR03790 family)